MLFQKIIFTVFIVLGLLFTEVISETSEIDVQSDLLEQSYFEHGMTFMIPGGANYTMGYWWKRMGFRFTVGGLPAVLLGTQLEARVRLVDKVKVRHSLSAGIGTTFMRGNVQNNYYHYGAGFYNIRFKRFFTQIGIASGYGTYKNPQGLLQCGFLIRKGIQQEKVREKI